MILRNYILKETLRSFIGIFIVVFAILLSTQLLRVLSDVADGKISLQMLFVLLGLRNIESMELILPFTLFFAIILSFSRLYKDSEMTAMNACGIGPAFLFKSILPLVIILFLTELLLSLFIFMWFILIIM